MKKNILIIVIVAISFFTLGVGAAIVYNASDITFESRNENWNATNVQEALDELFDGFLDNKTIYKDGIINTKLVGCISPYSFNSSGGNSSNEGIPTIPSINYGEDNISVSLVGNQLVGQLFGSKKINLTNVNSVKMHVNNASIQHNNLAYQSISMMLTSSISNQYATIKSTGIVYQNGIRSASHSISDEIISIDVSDITGEYYFGINIRSNGSLTFDKIWME